jgi:hypothetical protein
MPPTDPKSPILTQEEIAARKTRLHEELLERQAAARKAWREGPHAEHLREIEEDRSRWRDGPHQEHLEQIREDRSRWQQGPHADHVRQTHEDRQRWRETEHAEHLRKIDAERAAKKAARKTEGKRSPDGIIEPLGGKTYEPQTPSGFVDIDNPPEKAKAHFQYLDDAGAKTLQMMAKEHPEIPVDKLQAIVTDITNAKKGMALAYNDEMNKLRQPNEQGVPADRRTLNKAALHLQDSMNGTIQQAVADKHGELGKEVLTEFNRRTSSPTIIGGVTRQFFDRDDGGMQWGGILGAVIGGLLGWSMLGGAGFGTLLTVGGILLATLAGGWAGNKAADTISDFFAPTPKPIGDAPAATKAPTPAAEKENTISPELAEQARIAALTGPPDPKTLPPEPAPKNYVELPDGQFVPSPVSTPAAAGKERQNLP